MLISRLLSFAAQPTAPSAAENVVDALVRADQERLQWALDAGLGPMLFRATRQATGARLPANLEQKLLSAELTAKVRHAAYVTTMLDVLDVCAAVGAPATLLKGISISEQCYERPHERTMTDIDVLVPLECYDAVEQEALRRGYEHGLPVMGPDPHHGEPLVHPETRTKVEIHTALFQQDSRLRSGELFDIGSVERRSTPVKLNGTEARRLHEELQLVYIASCWVNNLCENPMDQSFMAPLFDAVVLLRKYDRHFDWNRLLASLDNEVATASLYVMLDYLARREFIEAMPALRMELKQRQNLVGRAERAILHRLIDSYLLAGRRFTAFHSWHIWLNLLESGPHAAKVMRLPWRVAFPPRYPHRFDPLAQARRLMRRLRR